MKSNGKSTQQLPKFNRANFFNGLIASPKYWNDIQEYHYSKENFYNKVFHGYGIIENVLNKLKVQPMNSNASTCPVVVNTGAAIDKQGRGVFLYEPQAITIDYRKYKLPATVYITARYKEVMEEYYQNDENPDFHGYRWKQENAVIEVRTAEPDGDEIELARIRLEENKNGEVPGITEAKDFSNPGPNSIDLRFIKWAAIAKEGLSPYLKEYLVDVLEKTRNISQLSYDALSIAGFRELNIISLTAKMLVQCGDVRFDEVVHTLHPIFAVDNQILQEMLEYERKENKHLFSIKSGFDEIRNAVFEMGDLLKTFEGDYFTIDSIIKKHQLFINNIHALFVNKKMSLQDVSVISYEMPKILIVGDERFTMVDYLDVRDRENTESHKLRFEDTSDVSTSNIALSYPDGVVVRDTVKRYVGGSAHFAIKNIIKSRKLLLVRRTDVVNGDYSIDIMLDKKERKRTLTIDTVDSKNRWRNCYVVFEEEEITSYSMPVEFSLGEKGRDNFGTIWVYQKI